MYEALCNHLYYAADPTAPMNITIMGTTSVVAGQSTTLRCTATGIPEPTITYAQSSLLSSQTVPLTILLGRA